MRTAGTLSTCLLSLELLLACSSDLDVGQLPPEPEPSGGTTGVAAGGGAAGRFTAAGGASGGIAGEAGAAAAGAASSNMASCPKWPTNKLMPYVGLLFYGPNPGPCTVTVTNAAGAVTDTWTLTYDAERLVSEVRTSGLSVNYEWTDGLLTTERSVSDTSTDTTTHVYAEGQVTTSYASSQRQNQYTLEANGYPTTVLLMANGTVQATAEYRYENCRLVRRVVTPNTSSGVAQDCAYEYDAEGRIVTRRYDTGVVERFDYGCW